MTVDVDLWADVVGQPRAMADLQAAVAAPSHAYLFVGPPGSGRLAAARAFAAALFSAETDGEAGERHARLALEGKHPDLIVFEPEGLKLSVDLKRSDNDLAPFLQEANRAPVEAARKVIVLGQFHTMEGAAGAFLKTIEEPPPRTIIVVVADEIPPDLVTVASRCVRIEFGPVPPAAIIERLQAEGVAPEKATEAAAAAVGDLARARLLATDPELADRRTAWWRAPERLGATGAAAVDLVGDLRGRIDAAQAPLDAQHTAELADLEEQIERYGLRKGLAGDLVTRQKRQVRTLRRQEIRFGLATVAGRYRDVLATTSDPAPIVAGLDAIQEAAEDLVRNPNEELLLLGLFLALPRLR